MAKKPADPGLIYVQSLGIRTANSEKAFYERAAKAGGKETAEALRKFAVERAEKAARCENVDDRPFYELKHSSYDLGFAVTAAADGDFIRRLCSWIAEHSDFFGSTVLEAGCENGLISCFMGLSFPQKRIVAVDRCAQAVENARRLAAMLGVTNVEFRCCELSEVKERFDTVLSSRVLHENFAAVTPLRYEEPLAELAEEARKNSAAYAHTLRSLTAENGCIVTVESMFGNPLLLGWFRALSAEGFRVGNGFGTVLETKSLGTESDYPLAVAVPGEPEEPEILEDLYCAYIAGSGWNDDPAKDWIANFKLHLWKKDLIEGWYGYNDYGEVILKYALWTDAVEPDAYLVEQMLEYSGTYSLALIDESLKDSVLEAFHRETDSFSANGGRVTRFEYVDGREKSKE